MEDKVLNVKIKLLDNSLHELAIPINITVLELKLLIQKVYASFI